MGGRCKAISKTCTALGGLDQTRPRLFRRDSDFSAFISAQTFQTPVQNIGRLALSPALSLYPFSLWALSSSLPSMGHIRP